VLDQAHENVPYKLTSLLLLGQGGTFNTVPSWDLSGQINDLTSKKIPIDGFSELACEAVWATARKNLIVT
jgi:hypothetical protein